MKTKIDDNRFGARESIEKALRIEPLKQVAQELYQEMQNELKEAILNKINKKVKALLKYFRNKNPILQGNKNALLLAVEGGNKELVEYFASIKNFFNVKIDLKKLAEAKKIATQKEFGDIVSLLEKMEKEYVLYKKRCELAKVAERKAKFLAEQYGVKYEGTKQFKKYEVEYIEAD